MKTELIEIETLKQLQIMNKENKVRPSLMTPKHYDGSMVVTNSFTAIKVDDEKYKDDGRTDYPTNAVQLFDNDPEDWIELGQSDMKALKEFTSTFKRLKEATIMITFEKDNFIIKGYKSKIETILPYQQIKLSGDIIGKTITVNPKYMDQIITYYIRLKAMRVKIEYTDDVRPFKVTNLNVQYLAAQIRNPR